MILYNKSKIKAVIIMKNPTIKICPVKELIEMVQNESFQNTAAIISTSYSEPQELKALDSYIVLRYDDVDMPIINRSIKESDCQKAVDFIKANRNKDTLYFCCDSAISRSSAMAASAYRFFDLDDMKIWENPKYSPNALVFKMMCDAFNLPLDDCELDYRISVNWKALKKRHTF